MDRASAEALASLLEGSGAFQSLIGGKRSHKAQYVRWLLGKTIEKRPEARVEKEGRVHYEPPYYPVTPFAPKRIQPSSESERFGLVPRSEFINRMLEAQEGRSTAVKRGAVAMELKGSKAQKKRKFKIAVAEMKARAEKKKAEAPPPPAEPFPPGTPINMRNLDALIIHLSKKGMTTRAIVKKIKDDYNYETSQPTVTRRVKAFNDGKIDETGKKI